MIIFLDFDGVTHPYRGGAVFSRVEYLWQILRAIEANVVFTTSWRDDYPFDQLVDFATVGGGEDLAHRFIGATPSIEYSDRGAEVQEWIDSAGYDGKWLILDDAPELFSSPEGLYLINGKSGLTEQDVFNVLKVAE
ncbi:HAD domain-containing protein [Sulfuriferula nivalis]|uniref:Uncharacterized protein n=1 Tax=Sulfuriferula nivalis TaxID=2675298 RepID=A0A809RF42_9PROT|nr:HAD domain-containing protein [Sulfuriferula nivalis]BBO99493.1 hypothetical protein SFSGTM_02020 [Sulfuriferula nivalis]